LVFLYYFTHIDDARSNTNQVNLRLIVTILSSASTYKTYLLHSHQNKRLWTQRAYTDNEI